jgi:hypothetical protein
MKVSNRAPAAALFIAFTSLVGCASSATDEDLAPAGDLDGLESRASITSVNAAGTWVASAEPPAIADEPTWKAIAARATFTGPATTRRMGVCLLRKTNTPCNTVADCGNAPASLPAGGFKYCTNVDNVGQKYCSYRPGPATTFCAGTPANGNVPIPPGTYQAPWGWDAVASYVSYACFEGCAATDPSVSSASRTPQLR